MEKEVLNHLQPIYEEKLVRRMHKLSEKIVFDYQEVQDSHNTFEWFEELLEYIYAGDREGLSHRLEEGIHIDGSPGAVSGNHLQNEKYLAVCVVGTISFKVNEMRLLDGEASHSIADAAITLIDQERTLEGVLRQLCACLYVFTERIASPRSGAYHSLIKRTKRYIHENLHTHIRLSDIALELDCNPSYLSYVFSRDEGMTITTYIRKKRIEQSCSLLKYSSMKISDICATLQFASQSHFGHVFKSIKGVTPSEYRARFWDENDS